MGFLVLAVFGVVASWFFFSDSEKVGKLNEAVGVEFQLRESYDRLEDKRSRLAEYLVAAKDQKSPKAERVLQLESQISAIDEQLLSLSQRISELERGRAKLSGEIGLTRKSDPPSKNE